LQFGFFGIECRFNNLPCRTGLRREKPLEIRKKLFSVLKRGLTGIAAWSAQASDRARSIGLSKPILRPTVRLKVKIKKAKLRIRHRRACK
jgi:hypothetical protein